MKTLRLLLLIALVFVPLNLLPAPAAQGLTEAMLKNMMTAMEKASQKHDAKALMAHFLPDAKIILDLPENMGGRLTLSPAEYQQMLAQAWQADPKSTLVVQNPIIKIGADGQSATYTALVIETVEVQGKKITGRTEEKVGVVLSKGKPLIKILYGKVVFDL